MNRSFLFIRMALGKKLKWLHLWNAWTVLLLSLTGILLYIPALRGDILGVSIRVALKQLHIGLGIVSLILLLLYIPLMMKHTKQIRGKTNQQWNLGTVLVLLIGWIVSGMALTYTQFLPDFVSSSALVIHDLITWIGIPWTVYHSITRMRWLRAKAKTSLDITRQTIENQRVVDANAKIPANAPVRLYTRRQWLRAVIGLGLALIVGPSFYRWLKTTTDDGGASVEHFQNDANRMLPPPSPLPDSSPPAGGGSKGNFRVYTVTKIPTFHSDDWAFTIGGLVEQPIRFDWNQFLALPRYVQVSDFHCVTGWSVRSCTWEGIALSTLLDLAEIKREAKFVKFYSGDGVYTDALSLEQAKLDDVQVAVLLDGKPIPQKLGGPVRLIVPKMYAYKSVKWLQSMELIAQEHLGYWQVRGYDNDAWVPGLRPKL